MQQISIELPEIKLIGVTIRTNNDIEMTPEKGKIGELSAQYWGDNMPNLIPSRKDPGKTYAVYTEYEGDERGDYTYFIGEEVTENVQIPEGFKAITIPPRRYTKFTTNPGPIPEVLINAWRQIWLLGDKDMGGKRAFEADLEVIDIKNLDPQNAVFDIYIGVK